MKNTVENAKYFAKCLMDLGLKLAYGGTDSHLLLIDLKCLKSDTGYPVTGEIATRILDLCGITCNKNTISGDTNAAHPTAIRFGMPWVTQRGISKPELKKLAELVNKVLTNIKPFHYVDTVCTDGTGDEIGRGKIDMEVIEEVQHEVQKIIENMNDRLPSFRTGYPDYNEVSFEEEPVLHTTEMHDEHKRLKAKLAPRSGWVMPVSYTSTKDELKVLSNKVGIIDSADRGIIELTGDPDRVSAFLHEATTNDMLSLEVGECKRTLLFDKKGVLVDDMMVYRLSPKNNGFARFLVTTHPNNTERVLTMFRFLSDEYVVFDEDKDIHAKIQGPMIVRDLKNQDENNTLTRLDLVGPNALKLLKKLEPKLPNMKDFSVIKHKIKGFDVLLSKITYPEKTVRFSIFVHPDYAKVLWKTILSIGKSLGLAPVGIDARNELRKRSGLPLYEIEGKGKKSAKRPKITEIYNAKSQYLFFLTKPYFVGQKKLLNKLKQKTKKKKYIYKPKDIPVRKSCLNAEHRKLGGKMVPFAGWEMPVMYANSSINEEHNAVRDTVGLFDVSHMGVFEFSGKYATRFLDLITSNYVSWLYPGQAHYSYFLDPNGNVIDDIFLYRVEKEHYMMVVNAANAEEDWAWIQAVREKKHIIDNTFPEIEVEGELKIRNLKETKAGSDQCVDLALQGPNALKVLLKLASDKASRVKISRLQKMEFVDVKLKGINVRIARTGYTGAKLGYELYLHPKEAPKLWNHLIKDSQEFGLVATGLGARDSTRTEAGFPLHGNELAGDYKINPVEAGYGAFIKLHKPYFIGREAALNWAKARDMEVVRYKMDGKGVKVVKTHDPVANERGEFIGNVTSSVSIEGYQMGLAYIKKRFNKAGTKLNIFSLPRQHGHDQGKPKGMAKGTYQLGDKTVVPVSATVLPRFPEEGELEDTNYE
jgi:glycine cleavage system T protein